MVHPTPHQSQNQSGGAAADHARITIGFLSVEVRGWYEQRLMAGVADAAAEEGVNLVFFLGGKLEGCSPGQGGIYELAGRERLDGLIISGTLGHGIARETVDRFCTRYRALPIVSWAVDLPDVPMVLADNLGGMRRAVVHLIETHSLRRIAFIRGPAGQIEAEQRYQAYADALAEYGIPLDPDLVVAGDFSPESGRTAMHRLLEGKGHIQAVVAANDHMAIGAMEFLRERGLRVPQDIAVVGFDDIGEGQYHRIPLTTVRQLFYTAGQQAARTLLRHIRAQDVPAQSLAPTELVIRRSCGCLPVAGWSSAESTAISPYGTADLSAQRDLAIATLSAVVAAAADWGEETVGRPDVNEELLIRQWDTFLASIEAGNSQIFLESLDDSLREVREAGGNLVAWHGVLEALRDHSVPYIADRSRAWWAEDLLYQAGVLVSGAAVRAQAYGQVLVEKKETALQQFSRDLDTVLDLSALSPAATVHFPALGIRHCYLALYEREGLPTEQARLILAYDGQDQPVDNQFYPSAQLLPDDIWTAESDHAWVITPLTAGERHLGFMVTDFGLRSGETYARLRELFGGVIFRALRTAELARRVELLNMINRVGRELTTSLDPAEVTGRILEDLAAVVPFERGSVLVQEGTAMRIVAQRGFPEHGPVHELRIQIREGDVYEQIATTRSLVLIDDVTKGSNWQQVDWLPLNRSWLGAPLIVKDRVIGMVSLTRREAGAFTREDAAVVSIFSLQAATSLENARLYDEVRRFSEQLEGKVQQRTAELDQAYKRLERLDRVKYDFIRVSAHELRTPLTVIKGYTQVVQSLLAGDDPSIRPLLAGILSGTDRLNEIVGSMFDVTKLDVQALEMHRERTMLQAVLAPVAGEFGLALQQRRLALILDGLECLPAIQADPQLLRKAFYHLVINAIKYTPDGGTIRVIGRMLPGEPAVEIVVSDTGIGIDPAYHELVFEKFFQTGEMDFHSSGQTEFKAGGPGLGLPIAKGIVEAHGGRIWAESEGHDEEHCPGSTFHVVLPVGGSELVR
jgi:DNA-binding LacI/PurR family transcriptional regulator/signal transduction histidine kinase